MMGTITFQCDRKKQPAAGVIFDYLNENGYARQLDAGYRVINYKDTKNPKRDPVGAGDGKVICEELWENSFIILDELGQKKKAVQEYHDLRRLIETQTQRPIPWVLETPTAGVPAKKRRSLEKDADKIRLKVRGAIGFLERLLTPLKAKNPAKYQRCLIACLYWFVLVDESGKGTPLKLGSFLKDQGLSKESIDKIKGEFSKYLQGSGDGLGLDTVKKDATVEATALQTVLQKRGWCTELSKVMYAVLRMAGIEAFFVEPKISVEDVKAKDIQPNPPLPSHTATGIGIKFLDENGVERIWIIDLALGLLETDYIEDNKDSKWKAHPYWILSLRHFWMIDLSNLGVDQQNTGEFKKAEESFELALNLGEDSTAHFAMGNYPDLIRKQAKTFSPLSSAFQKAKSLIEKSTSIYPYSAKTLFDKGWYLAQEYKWQEAFAAFLQSIKADLRHGEAYHNVAVSLYGLRLVKKPQFYEAWDLFKREMHELLKNHPPLREEIEGRLQKMSQRLLQLNDSNAKELIELINGLHDTLFPR